MALLRGVRPRPSDREDPPKAVRPRPSDREDPPKRFRTGLLAKSVFSSVVFHQSTGWKDSPQTKKATR